MSKSFSVRELVAAMVIAGIAACGGTQTPPAAEGPLTLVAFSPEAGDIGAEEPLRFTFDLPVVGEEQVGVPLADPPVRLEPAAKVSGVWIDRQTLLVRPEGELAPSTRYRALLAPALARRLRDEPALSFVNRPLRQAGQFGFDPDLLPVDARIGLRFDQDVGARDLEDHCLLRVPRTGEVIDVVTPDPELVGPEMVLSPALRLEKDEVYVLECVELAGHGGDAPMEGQLIIELRTHPDLHVVSFGPTGKDVWSDEVPIEIEFSTPVDGEKLRRALSAKPAIEGLERGTLDEGGRHFRVVVDLKSDTDYALRLDEDFTDVLGQRLEEQLGFGFTTGSARPRFSMETGIFAVEAATGEGYPIWTRNVSRYDVECARVPEKGLVALLTGEMNYDPWYDAGSEEDIGWKKLSLARRQRKVRVKQPKDQWHLERIPLGETCGGKGARGVFLAEVRSDEVVPDPDQYWKFKSRQRVLANVTDLGVLLKAGASSGVVWVTRLSDGAPVAGARVTVYDTRGRKAHTGSTDAGGIARLPGADELLRQGGAGDKGDVESADEEGEEYDTWRGRRFIVVVEQGGDLAVVDGNWSNGIQIWNFGLPADYRGGAARHRGFILSDRGIYRPGEQVHFKGLVRELAPGRLPAIPSGKHVAVRVEDARGLTVFDRRVPLSEFGGFHFDLALGAEASLGDWHVTARIGGRVFRESFIVEEFRKVTYEVEIDAGDRHTRLGRRLRFNVRAGYLFGAPVTGAGVEWSVMRRAHSLHFAGFQDYSFTDMAADGDGWWWWDRDDYENLEFVAD
ncbi:MAG TPA: MG2 domain-containing protein, partial [Polyangia bacterium]|nr:MG2 domain-containing protein [Polyangia bacterium]